MDIKPGAVGGASKLQEYELGQKLGQGSFGIVYKVKRKSKPRPINTKTTSEPMC